MRSACIAGTPTARQSVDASMIRIAISVEAFDGIARTLPLGSVGYENKTDEQGQRLIWLDRVMVDRLRAMRGPGESYSDVILRLRAKLDAYAEPVTPAALNIELGHLERHAQGLRGKEFSQLRIEEMSPYIVGQSSVVVVVVGLAQRWQRHPSYCHRN
jgi:hypothetical protein